MERLILTILVSLLIPILGLGQIVEIPINGNHVNLSVSGSIYYPDMNVSLQDPIYGLVVMYVSDEQDGSASKSVILGGTHYYKRNPDQIQFTLNSATNRIHVFGLEMQRPTQPSRWGPITGQYNVTVNGVDYIIRPNNVVYLVPPNSIEYRY